MNNNINIQQTWKVKYVQVIDLTRGKAMFQKNVEKDSSYILTLTWLIKRIVFGAGLILSTLS